MSENLLAQLVAGVLEDDDGRVGIIAECRREIDAAGGFIAVPSLINRIWLGADSSGYVGQPAYELIGTLPRIAGLVSSTTGLIEVEKQPAVALGSLVEVDLGQPQPAYAEVVWKEGAHTALSADYLPQWLAGAPSLADSLEAPSLDSSITGSRILRERLVLNFFCFGEACAPSAARFERLRGNARWLDQYGHLVLNVEYNPGEDEDDLSFWATWVCAHAAQALMSANVDPDPAILRRCVGQLLEALSSQPGVRAFGPYLMSDVRQRELVHDFGDIYENVAHGLARVHRSDRTAWGSMSQRLAERIPDAMVGSDWAEQVMAASLYTLDLLASEAPGGDWDGVHLRLDDAWQGGGLWRAEELDDVGPLAIDPAIALGLGWAEFTGEFGELSRQITAPAWLAEVDDGIVEEPEWRIDNSEVVWTTHVSPRDIDAGRLPVPSSIRPVIEASLVLVGQDRLVTQIHHEGEAMTFTWGPLQPSGHFSVDWSPTVQVGTRFMAVWSLEGKPIVRAFSRRMAEPVEIGGVTYLHEFDEQMVRAHLGLIERPAQVVTLERLVRAAVRHYGELAPTGQWCLSLEEICSKCFGPTGEVAPHYKSLVLLRAVEAAVSRLVRSGRAARQGNLVLVAETTNVSSQIDRDLLDRYFEGQAQRLRREASRTWVPPGVVNLPPGWRASPEKISTWAEVAGTDHLPAGELGRHQTWRRGHVRGETLSPAIERDLERAARTLAEMGANPEQLAKLRLAAQLSDPSPEDANEQTIEPATPHGDTT